MQSRIRVRAEWRLGEILRAMAESGGRATREDGVTHGANKHLSRDVTSAPTLAELNIPRDRASRAMQLAGIPKKEFELVAVIQHETIT